MYYSKTTFSELLQYIYLYLKHEILISYYYHYDISLVLGHLPLFSLTAANLLGKESTSKTLKGTTYGVLSKKPDFEISPKG